LATIAGIIIPLMVQRASSATPKDPPAIPSPKPPVPEPPKQQGPHIHYVPQDDPFRKPNTLVTSVPKDGEQVQTVVLNGQRVRVMTREDLEKVLSNRAYLSDFVKGSSPVDLVITVQTDGKVADVRGLSDDEVVGDSLKDAVKQWRFKPFVKDGQDVAVQTVIQLKGSKTEKP
jgi:outer membrane biosynthesis protein TonB